MIEELYRENYNYLLRWCQYMTGERALAEDITQETFLRALENISTLTDLSKIQRRAWLTRTARNLQVDAARRAAHVLPGELEPEPSRWDDYTEQELLEACQILPESERGMFILRYFEGYNSTELGELYGLAPSTIRGRLRLAVAKVKKYYFEGE